MGLHRRGRCGRRGRWGRGPIRKDLEGGAGDLLRAGVRGRLAQGALRYLVSRQESLVDRQAEEVAQVARSAEPGSHLPAVSENRVRVLPRQDDVAARLIGNRPERQHEILRRIMGRIRPGHRDESLPAARQSDVTHNSTKRHNRRAEGRPAVCDGYIRMMGLPPQPVASSAAGGAGRLRRSAARAGGWSQPQLPAGPF